LTDIGNVKWKANANSILSPRIFLLLELSKMPQNVLRFAKMCVIKSLFAKMCVIKSLFQLEMLLVI